MATYRHLQAVDGESQINKILLMVAYAASFDKRNGASAAKAVKIVAVALRAIQKYKDKPARVAVVNPANDGEWQPEDGEHMPIMVMNYPDKDTLKFMNSDTESIVELIGKEAWANITKGVNSHPLFAHIEKESVAGAFGLANTIQCWRHAQAGALAELRSRACSALA